MVVDHFISVVLIMAEHQLTEAGANGQTSLRVVAPVGEVYSTEQEHALINREWHNENVLKKNESSSFQTFQKYIKKCDVRAELCFCP